MIYNFKHNLFALLTTFIHVSNKFLGKLRIRHGNTKNMMCIHLLYFMEQNTPEI